MNIHAPLKRSFTSALLGVTAIALAACGTVPWGSGGLGDGVAGTSVDSHGVVVSLGVDALTDTAEHLGDALAEAIGDGVSLTGAVGLDGENVFAVHFRAVLLQFGDVRLSAGDTGVTANVSLSIEATEIAVDDGVTPLCAPILSVDRGTLTLSLSLVADKRGRVQAELRTDPALTATALNIDWTSCALGFDAIDLPVWTQRVWRAIAAEAATVLGPALIDRVPAALGIDLAASVGATVSADEIGTGVVRASLQAVERNSGGDRWSVSGSGVRVPFSVAVEVDRHPCAPDLPLTPVKPTPIDDWMPAMGRTMAVATGFVRRALQVVWQSGALCGDNLTEGILVKLDRATLGGWIGDRLPTSTEFGVKLWPRGLPTLNLSVKDDDVAALALTSGPVDVDVYALIDGAEVRLASVSVDVAVDFGITATQEGWLILALHDVSVGQRAGHPGLFDVPPASVIDAVLTPMLRDMLTDLPLISLPPGPSFRSGPLRATATRSHLLIGL